ncbi:MAG: glycosyltransferase family 4 protein [Fusobacterium sp.]|uniref:glycosyltransferase family 4 protein n=1 Tax=Fusobacterium sp. TaxID=68766 RepID=UPI002A74DAAD|nr:glycosyltransferase family 4 protein [Fusobacterium sp.]MDY2980882.1 glycosyltransferase family 4 protein [Fusobacterium sp.]
MRVLQVVKTNRGATWAFNQAKYLKELGIDIITVLPNTNEGYALEYKKLGMKVIEGDWSLPLKSPWMFFQKVQEIKKTIEKVSPDVIHLHFVTNVLMLRLALYNNKIPRLFQVPGPLHLENKLINFIERLLAKENDYWAGACKKTCSVYREKGIDSNKIFLAYYGVPQSKEKRSHSKNILHSEYKIPDKNILIGMVSYFYKPKKFLGQIRGLKGHEDFIDAMEILLKKYNNLTPIIIGNAWDGSEKYEEQVREYAYRKLGKKVIFTGYRNDIYEVYPELNIVVHPSHSENLGGAAESLMLGVPTIATDIGGFPDIVIPNKTGCLSKVKNPEDLSLKIEWALENEEEMKRMAIEGQKNIRTLLDLKNTSKKILEIYHKIKGE